MSVGMLVNRRYGISQPCRGNDLVNMIHAKTVLLWDMNREINRNKVAALVEAMAKTRDPEYLGPCAIFIGDLPDGRSYLLDGQHRASALAEVQDPGRFIIYIVRIRIATETDLAKEFELINCGTPVPPEYWDGKICSVVKEFIFKLECARPQTASNAEHPHRPRYNSRRVMSNLCGHAGLRDAIRYKGLDADALLQAAFEADRFATALHQRDSPAPHKCLVTAHRLNFHLGLDSAWPYQVAIRAINAR